MEEIKSEIRSALAAIMEIDETEIDDAANLAETLGLDSLQALELVVKLEKKYKIEIPQAELRRFTSINNVAEIVASYIREGALQAN